MYIATGLVTQTLAVFIGLMLAGGAAGDVIEIDDSGDTPGVKVLDSNNRDVTAQRVKKLQDSKGEFLHFQLKLPGNEVGNGGAGYTDLFEDKLDGKLSDRIFIQLPRLHAFEDVMFASDPDLKQIDVGRASKFGLNAVEDGTFQTVATIPIGGGFTNDVFKVKSDNREVGPEPKPIPEPAVITLLGFGVAGLFGYQLLGKCRAAKRPTSYFPAQK